MNEHDKPTADESLLLLLENTSENIRNTLSVDYAAIEVLSGKLEDKKENDLLKYVAMIKHSHYKLLRMARNIENILAYERNTGTLNLELIDMRLLCSNLTSTVSALISGHNITLSFINDCNSDSLIGADPAKIETMLLNLLSNSIKLTPVGGEIVLRLKDSGDGVHITISDSGPGLDYEALDTVFEDYKRPRSLDESERGLGIGMTAALHIAKLHHGNIFVEKSDKRGLTLGVFIPDNRGNRTVLRQQYETYNNDGMKNVLTILADVLGFEKYLPPFLE